MTIRTSFAGAMVLASIVLASPGRAQTPAHQHGAQVQTQPPAEQMKGQMAGDQKMAEMKKMMAEKMAAKEAAADRLAALMTKMKEATGEAKVTAMADVIAALVEQRAAMDEHCAQMMMMMKMHSP